MKEATNKLKQATTAKRTNLAEWRASHIHELDLPSGLHVKVRDVDMTDLVLSGSMPTSVLARAEEAAKITDEVDLMKMAADLMKTNGPEFKQMLDGVVRAALIEPQIAEVADDTHILLDELTFADKNAIMDFINREVEQLHPFREKQAELIAALQHGDSLRKETEPVPTPSD